MISMTGYAQGRFTFDDFTLFVSLKSLNHRYLEIGYKGNGPGAEIEKIFRSLIKGRIHRGKIELNLNLFEFDQGNWDIQLNEALLEAIVARFDRFQERHPGLTLSLDSFLRIPMVFHLESFSDTLSEQMMRRISDSLEEVIERFMASRREEGRQIEAEIKDSLGIMDGLLRTITLQAREVEEHLVQHYRERIRALIGEIEFDERRILQEAAMAADRSCIAEELSRLAAHSERMKQICGEESEFIGREADFLAQELLRETHTIAAKTGSLDVHRTVMQIRRQVEKIKQQVQNVE